MTTPDAVAGNQPAIRGRVWYRVMQDMWSAWRSGERPEDYPELSDEIEFLLTHARAAQPQPAGEFAAGELIACRAELDDAYADRDRHKQSGTVLRAAAKVYMAAVRALGEFVPDERITYFEANPLKDGECYNRWLRLNESGKVLASAIKASQDVAEVERLSAARPASGRVTHGSCPVCDAPIEFHHDAALRATGDSKP